MPVARAFTFSLGGSHNRSALRSTHKTEAVISTLDLLPLHFCRQQKVLQASWPVHRAGGHAGTFQAHLHITTFQRR